MTDSTQIILFQNAQNSESQIVTHTLGELNGLHIMIIAPIDEPFLHLSLANAP